MCGGWTSKLVGGCGCAAFGRPLWEVRFRIALRKGLCTSWPGIAVQSTWILGEDGGL
jgi:hypothetical protein